MTLLVTAVAGDGIVMGADSALTFPRTKESNDEIICLNNFQKIVFAPKQGICISMAGALLQESPKKAQSIFRQIHEYAKSSDATTHVEFVNGLIEGLNNQSNASEDTKKPLVALKLGAWVQPDTGPMFPVVDEISNKTGSFKCFQRVSEEIKQKIISWRQGNKSNYPIEFITAGCLPLDYSKWIGEVGFKQHSELVDRQILCSDVSSLAEYVRFLIRSISDLYRISGQPGFVGEPIEIAIVPPETLKYVSVRY